MNASYGLVELLFQVENTKAKQALESMDIYPQDGQVLLSRKIMEGRSISKINGEVCTVSQMKAAAACLIDIHGQHEHQSLLYPDKQLEILDIYGKEKIQPVKEKVEKAYKEYRKCEKELQAFNMDEEQRNRKSARLLNLKSGKSKRPSLGKEKTRNWKRHTANCPMDERSWMLCRL